MKRIAALLVCLGVSALLIAADEKPAPAKPSPFERVATKDLPNAYRLNDRLVSGGQPEGEQGFKDLKDLGVKTIISVDGAKPDVETAKKYGIRYVHMPITYSGVTEDEGKRIGKALSELEGPIYLHCHHGKNRSAAAVAVACVMNGSLKPEQAESVLETFGTGENYKGLWKAARDARPLDSKTLADVKVEYVEAAKVAELAERMIDIDHAWEVMKSFQKNGWKPLADKPQLDAAHEALQLQEHLRESSRGADVGKRPAEFFKMLTDSEASAEALHKALSKTPADATAADAAYKRVAASCTSCHKAYRD